MVYLYSSKLSQVKYFVLGMCQNLIHKRTETMTDAEALATCRAITGTHLRPISTNPGKHRSKNEGRKHKLRSQMKGYPTQTPPKEVPKAKEESIVLIDLKNAKRILLLIE